MRARSILPFASTHALALALAASASAVIIDSLDGAGNTSAPLPDDPGWRNVGVVNGLTGVYLGGRFVLTAAHVGWGDVVLDGTTYTYVPGTAVQIDNSENPGPVTYADLLMFQIYPEPPLPALSIASSPPDLESPPQWTLIGRGLNRGPATSWPTPTGPYHGYEWGTGVAMRWGTNFPNDVFFVEPEQTGLTTMAIETVFDQGVSADEAQAAAGDSGGAAFALNGTQWELAGILFAIQGYLGQPGNLALYGNTTYAADLSFYRTKILGVMAMPEPSGGLWPGAAVVALLARRRRARPTCA